MSDSNPRDVTQDLPSKPVPNGDAAPASHPERIGRYRIQRVLGQGGFGLVYLAHDEQLNRPVAVKVPHARLISKPEDAEAYLAEARTVANLDLFSLPLRTVAAVGTTTRRIAGRRTATFRRVKYEDRSVKSHRIRSISGVLTSHFTLPTSLFFVSNAPRGLFPSRVRD